MKKEQKLKQLEMALTGHKKLLLDLGDDIVYNLKWDDEISNYRGYYNDTTIGIWKLELLLQIIDDEIEDAKLQVL